MAKSVELEWYAIREDFNSHTLENYNVLRGLKDEIKKRIKREKITTKEEFKKSLRSLLMYHYWSKAEHEVLISGLFTRDNSDLVYKVDVWDQLEPNLDRIVEYVISALKLDLK